MTDRKDENMALENKIFDVVIAGAGVAGALIAHKLSQAGLNVLILDAGDQTFFDQETGSDLRQPLLERFFTNPVKMPNAAFPDLDYAPSPTQTTLNKYFVQKGPLPFQSSYTRMVGGTTYHWLGTALRYVPNTFQTKTVYGIGADWPIRYEDLQDWYWHAEKAIGVSGNSNVDLGAPRKPDHHYPMPEILPTYNDRKVREGTRNLEFEGMPVDFESTPQARNSILYQGRPPCAGSANCIPICPIQAKYDASVHLKWAINPKLNPESCSQAKAVTPLFGAVVTKVLVDRDKCVSGLKIKQPDHSELTITGRLYVLAMNAMETPKVLLWSATESLSNGVANSSGVVGHFLMDHDVKITYAKLPEPYYVFRGPLSSSGCESLRDGAFRKTRSAFRIELQNTGTSWATGSPFTNVINLVNQGYTGQKLREQLAWEVSTQIELNGLLEPEPNYNNSVKPSDSLFDPFGIPRPEIRYSVGEYARAGTKAFVKVANMICDRLGATHFSEVPGWFGAGHVMGTLRMGNDPKTSCCDSYGRTHDHPNLFLTGSGLFPTVGSANPTLTIVAVALRTAHHIIESFQNSPETTTSNQTKGW
ncbi:GMC family oxidoreductase [Moorena sp. SIO4G3]|uniref:GMC family oxidoreductase n=1 Tax=Moorena sp. SIO4G3 TaxID=2607821 RepID=UPI00142BCE47|nr:GMC family oxidoreductase [Moorena sp. SIO4G3]NEO77616.1 GMC family oxidoreductase [Moorena sp. SIO4G3]